MVGIDASFWERKFMIYFLFVYLCYLFQHMLKIKIMHLTHTHTHTSPLLNNSHNLQSYMYNYHNSITIIKNTKSSKIWRTLSKKRLEWSEEMSLCTEASRTIAEQLWHMVSMSHCHIGTWNHELPFMGGHLVDSNRRLLFFSL